MSSHGADSRGGRSAVLVLLCACTFAAIGLPSIAARASAGSPYPYGGRFHERLDELFFEPGHARDALANPEKVAAFEAFIQSKQTWLQQNVENREIHDGGESPKDAAKIARKLDVAIALEEIQRRLKRLAAAPDTATAHTLAADIVTLEYATRSFSEPIESIKIPSHLKNMVFEWRSSDESNARRAELEATNLVDPESGTFYTADQLAELGRSGLDISTLDPPAETPFWRERKHVSRVDIVGNYFGGGDPIHDGVPPEFPSFDGAVFELRKVHRTQTKPKLDVWYSSPKCAKKSRKKQKKCRDRVKLKFGMETHADPPANALLSAFGYNVDISKHLKNVRVYLGDYTLDELEKEWIGYFDQQRLHVYVPLESVIIGKGEDERGSYLVFQEAVAELKTPGVHRVGMFPFSSGIASQFREARALFLFNVWIGNADMKDAGNNKVALLKDESGEYRMYLIQQDLGHALGWVFPERPEAFPWDLVEDHVFARAFGAAKGSIEFNYIDLQDNGLREHATFADLKWMARKIASLSRDQITSAIDIGVWPGGIGQLYIEKLINRRNQLVEAFGLGDEFAMLPVDRELTTADGSVVDGHLVQNRYSEESPINYGDHTVDLVRPVFEFLLERTTGAVQSAVGAIDVLNPGDIKIGSNLAILPRLLIKLSRKVLLNPAPEGAFDQYIVVDTMDLGLRVGVGYIASAETAWMRRVTLAYPVPTHRRGLYGGVGALNFLRTSGARVARLPDKYVLYREDLAHAGLRASSEGTSGIAPLGVAGNQSWVTKSRSVLDHRGEDPILWIDEPNSLEQRFQLFLEFFDVVQIPFMEAGSDHGRLEGRLLKLDRSKLDTLDADGERIFDAILRRADFDDAEQLLAGEPRVARSEFARSGGWWNFIFVSWRTRTKEEQITIEDSAGQTLRVEHQAERRSSFAWSFIDNAEAQQLRVGGYLRGRAAADPSLLEPTVVVSFDVDDKNAHSDEFESYYRMLEGLGANRTYMAPGFTAQDWEVGGKPSGRWSRLLTTGTVQLDPKALEALMHVDEDGYWRQLARNLEISERKLARHLGEARRSERKYSRALRTPVSQRIHHRIQRSQVVLALLERARETKPGRKRMRLLVDAFYRANFRSGDTFDPTIMASLLEQAGMGSLADEGAVHIEGRITRAFEDEHNLPERRDLVGVLGEPGGDGHTEYSFFPFNGIELYNMLNWARDDD